MSYFEAFILGLVQGLTEFLPVSSSGHMLLFSAILGCDVPLAYTLIMHIATALAVVIFYFKIILTRIKRPFVKDNGLLLIATAFTAVIVLIMRKTSDIFQNINFLPIFFIITAIILIIGSFLSKGKKPIGYVHAIIIGISQGLACIPGLSRSGVTISTSLILGNDKKEATTFSFLLSLPVIVGSSIIELIFNFDSLSSVPILSLLIGFFTAFISGYFSLVLINKLMKNLSLDVFSVYLISVAIIMLVTSGFRL